MTEEKTIPLSVVDAIFKEFFEKRVKKIIDIDDATLGTYWMILNEFKEKLKKEARL